MQSLEAGNLQVRNDILAQGQLQVTGGVNIGKGGLFTDGRLTVYDDALILEATSASGQRKALQIKEENYM